MYSFPYQEEQWLVDRCNHIYVKDELLRHYDSDSWRIEYKDGSDWIMTIEGEPSNDFVAKMLEATSKYPPLDEQAYHGAEFSLIVEAVARKVKQTGTIIVNTYATVASLLDEGVEIIETSPMHYDVMMSDEEFKKTIEGSEEE